MLSEIKRVMTADGEGILAVYHLSLLKKLRSLLGDDSPNKKEGYQAKDVYYRNYSSREWYEMLKPSFQIDKKGGNTFWFPWISSKEGKMKNWLDGFLEKLPLSTSIFAHELLTRVRK